MSRNPQRTAPSGHQQWPASGRSNEASGTSQTSGRNDMNSLTLPPIRNLIGMVDGAQTTGTSGSQGVRRAQVERGQGSTDRRPSISNASVHSRPEVNSNAPSDTQTQSWPAQATSHSFGNSRERQRSIDSHPSASRPLSQSSYAALSYATSPSNTSHRSFPSPTSSSVASNVTYQRPTPSSEVVSEAGDAMHAPPNNSTPDQSNLWQHHHYIAPSTSAAFAAQQTDRYICNTCNKAFSRPSSLRIHSHSHTGEKPFRCPHAGCGKAFSVRSNMKRHERGCHTGMSPGTL